MKKIILITLLLPLFCFSQEANLSYSADSVIATEFFDFYEQFFLIMEGSVLELQILTDKFIDYKVSGIKPKEQVYAIFNNGTVYFMNTSFSYIFFLPNDSFKIRVVYKEVFEEIEVNIGNELIKKL